MADGDLNTHYFPSKVSQRKWKNAIHRIKDASGTWKEKEAKDQVIIDHFKNLFIAQGAALPSCVLDVLKCRALVTLTGIITLKKKSRRH